MVRRLGWGQKNVRQMIGGTSSAWNGSKDVMGELQQRSIFDGRGFDG